MRPTVALLLTACFITGCGNSSPPSAVATPSVAADATVFGTAASPPNAVAPPTVAVQASVPMPVPTRSAAPTAIAITGFGATNEEWNATHTRDPNYPQGQVYDPDPAIAMDRYQAVGSDGGRIDGYNMRISPTTLAEAEAAAKAEMPPDATVRWTAKRDVCVQMEWKSASLGRVLAALGDPTGDVYVELDTANDATGGATLDVNHINEMIFGLGSYLKASDAPGC